MPLRRQQQNCRICLGPAYQSSQLLFPESMRSSSSSGSGGVRRRDAVRLQSRRCANLGLPLAEHAPVRRVGDERLALCRAVGQTRA